MANVQGIISKHIDKKGTLGFATNVIGKINPLIELIGRIGYRLIIVIYKASSTYFLASNNVIKASHE